MRDVIEFCTTIAINKNNELQDRIRRRLAEEEPVKVIKSRKYSLTVGIKLGPKEEPVQHAKNSHRFLNYGPDTDICMWNMFDAKKVSNECASALMYVNDSSTNQLDQYTNMYENTSSTYQRMSITISSAGICLLLSMCAIYAILVSDEDDDTNEESADDSDDIVYTAIPLTVV